MCRRVIVSSHIRIELRHTGTSQQQQKLEEEKNAFNVRVCVCWRISSEQLLNVATPKQKEEERKAA